METGESVLKELTARYGSINDQIIDHGTPILRVVSLGFQWKKYALYIGLFVWTLVVLIIARPATMFVVDPDTKKRRLKPGRVIGTLLCLYITLVGVVIGSHALFK